MLNLKLQYFGCLMQRADSLEKTLMLKKITAGGKGDDRGGDSWMASLTQWTGKPGVLQSMGSQRVRHDLVTKQEGQNWLTKGEREARSRLD